MSALAVAVRLWKAVRPVLGSLFPVGLFGGNRRDWEPGFYFGAEALEARQMLSATVVLPTTPNVLWLAGQGDVLHAGRVTTDFVAPRTGQAHAVALQSDGKIIAAGSGNSGEAWDFALARYNPDGSLDNTFGADGRVLTDFNNGSLDRAFAVAVQADGKIVLGGLSQSTGARSHFALARYNPDGSLDNSFGSGGLVSTAVGDKGARAYGLAIQADGKIIATGYTTGGADNDLALARYNANGSLDNTFGSGGTVITDLSGSDDKAYAVAIQANGRIVVAGATTLGGGGQNFLLARYQSDGRLDSSFQQDGLVVTDFGGQDDIAHALAIQSDGRIIAGGSAKDDRFGLARYLSTGQLDNSFSGNGKTTTAAATSIQSLAIQGNGSILAAGYRSFSKNGRMAHRFALARYTASGSLDKTFAAKGVLTATFGRSAQGRGLAIRPNGQAVVAGFAASDNSQASSFAVAQFNANGSYDACFGSSGCAAGYYSLGYSCQWR